MWAALTAIFIVVLITIGCSVVWLIANVGQLYSANPIPVAIAVILAYLLDPVVTKMCEKGLGRTKQSWAVRGRLSFDRRFGGVAGAGRFNAGRQRRRELPQYTQKARDTIVDLIFRYDHAFGGPRPGRDKVSPTTSC